MALTTRDFTKEYIDVDFSFARHPLTYNVSIKKKVSAVKQSVIHLMMLKEGDKPFHPEIKSPLYTFLFENRSFILDFVISDEVKKYLAIYEPRFIVSDVIIKSLGKNSIRCDITGTVISIQEQITVNILVDRLR